MICALSLRNFVLIDALDLEPGSGFTALTGETGAGKSIILDALGVALGGAAERRFIRAGASQASVSVAFSLGPGHPAWCLLEESGVDAGADEMLTLKRVIRSGGPARAFVNDQPVGAALLRRVGECIVEIHGQHAASALLRPAAHRELLDQFAGHDAEIEACQEAWNQVKEAATAADALRLSDAERAEELERLESEVGALEDLAPADGEADMLATRRLRLMQAERVGGQLDDVLEALSQADTTGVLGRAARILEQVSKAPGFDDDSEAGWGARAARDGLERGLIEVQEAERALAALGAHAVQDPQALEAAETRLFALRAAARRHGVEPDDLPGVLAQKQSRLDSLERAGVHLAGAEAAEREARARWHAAAETVSAGRKAAARRLEKAVEKELQPLKLSSTRFRVAIQALEESRCGGLGCDGVAFEVETNAGAGFGPLSKVASGGEMARLSLALKCALAGSGAAGTLIFDEADQGVGGAVAAAIGERLARLGADRQVFAITHSPQVAAAAEAQWSVSKTAARRGVAQTRVNGLDSDGRTEEIARMLAGRKVTPEARAAAERLLEDKCRTDHKSRLPT